MEEPYIIREVSELESRLNHDRFASDPFLKSIFKELTYALGKVNWVICSADEQLRCKGGFINEDWMKRLKNEVQNLKDFLDDIEVLIEGKPLEHPKVFSNLKNFRLDTNAMNYAWSLVSELESFVDSNKLVGDIIIADDIVGREKEKQEIVKMLIDNDHVLESLDYKAFLQCGMFEVMPSLQKAVMSNKYLLVLDDLDDLDKWLLLKPLLCGSYRGSRVIITSRSGLVAENMEVEGLQMPTGGPYELGPLPEEAAWTLFHSLVFDNEEKGKWFMDYCLDIFVKCANLPLAIKAIAALLSSPAVMRNQSDLFQVLREEDFVKVVQSTSRLANYNQLQSSIEKCCTFCSLYPKDYEFDKAQLIRVWMALGFIHPWTSEEKIDEFFKKYMIDEHFFDIGKRDSTGAVVSYKRHYITIELMKALAEDNCCITDMAAPLATQRIDRIDHCQHMSFIINSSWKVPDWFLITKPQLQSLLFLPVKPCEVVSIPNMDEVLSSQRGLRVLDLAAVHCEYLPDCIGQLKALRYLRLGVCSGFMPKCITQLENLQTLDLRHSGVRELPRGFVKLCHLRHLYTGERLIDLPPNFGILTTLLTLDLFIVGKNNGLDELSRLNSLGGKLGIRYEKRWGKDVLEECNGMLIDRYFTDLSLSWSYVFGDEAVDIGQQRDAMELEFLQPPSTLKTLTVKGWKGMQFPPWAINELALLLPNLISVQIVDCSRCKNLPGFSALPHLRSLQLWDLNGLEHIEICGDRNSSTTTFFPSLEYLVLANLPELKGWSTLEESDIDVQGLECHEYLPQHIFPCLSVLCLSNCPKLLLFPPAPRLELLEVVNIHEKLLKHFLSEHIPLSSSSASSFPSRLMGVDIVSVWGLKSLLINAATLESLAIRRCHDLINVVVQAQTPLQQFHVHECNRLKDIYFAQQSLSMLEELEIEHCEELDWGHKLDDGVIKSLLYSSFSTGGPWKGLKSLRSLKLMSISKLEILPRGFGCLTTLQQLSFCWLYNLRVLPEWIGYNLTQLRQLTIWCCPKLTILPVSLGSFPCLHQLKIHECPKLVRKCQKPNGEYWPLIQNISNIQLDKLSQ